MIATIVIQATEPENTMREVANTLWLNTTNGFLYYWNGSSYTKAVHSPAVHLHPTLGAINFTGSVSVSGVEGIDLDVSGKIEITRLKIEKGIITALEYEP